MIRSHEPIPEMFAASCAVRSCTTTARVYARLNGAGTDMLPLCLAHLHDFEQPCCVAGCGAQATHSVELVAGVRLRLCAQHDVAICGVYDAAATAALEAAGQILWRTVSPEARRQLTDDLERKVEQQLQAS
jgi:hypothetical protein